MMFFLSRRIEALRQKINPNAGIIIAHHTKKIFKKQTEEDPFQSFSGAGALRSYYTSGILLHRPDESRPERTLLFELRNGKEISRKLCRKKRKVERGCQVIFEMSPRTYQHIPNDHSRLLLEEARTEPRLYRAAILRCRFENHGSARQQSPYSKKMQGLADANIIKFFKNGDAYGLPAAQRHAAWLSLGRWHVLA
jgi:putative DNA primase/helicase